MSLSRTKKVGVELEFQYESIQDEEGRSRTRVPVIQL